MAKLNFMDRENLLREYEVDEDLITIGREATNKITISDPSVSRQHAWVEKREDGYYLVDKNSSNGSFVNGKKITEQKLNHNDKVQLGNAQMVFEDEEQVSATFILPKSELSQLTEPTTTQADMSDVLPEDRPTGAVDVNLASKATPPRPPEPPPPPPPPPPAPAPPPPPKVEAIGPTTCPSCKKPIEAGARFCGFCGAPIPAPRPSAPAPPPPPPPAAAKPPAPPPPIPPPPAARPPAPPPPAPPAPGAVHPLTHGFQPQPQAAPARIPGQIEYAGFGPRLIAYLIDGLIIGLLTSIPVAASMVFAFRQASTGEPSPLAMIISGLAYLLVLIISLGYMLYFTGLKGATPGKKMMKLKVALPDGTYPIGIGKAFLRLIGYMVSAIICYFGFIMIALDKEQHRGLHDKIAGTIVIKEP